ncbi:IclR family transcriptional regulator domain-containing protein [Mumia zhuanghuii]|uniref:Helix-turn-helix domain-containing protein n=1 Tax=Mumia zhuanghuii TaxID=2585211 RepID=A0A5C4MNN2_9ACTN|nr:IclR family transcriptional regulator C-terminal domain-containing protein [Mumia zhuanghuii]TNC45254.1 helix-turn-helix domain-containing protein [Mumia zhuanghuii]TNC47438.1 helix-turn-helix domain-containing protein [Mumia zhuanghuii]
MADEGRQVAPVQSLQRGLAVIRAFDAEHARMTLSEVAKQTGLTRATARRFLHTLVSLGYTDTDGREFWLRPRVLELGYAYLSSTSLPDIATPHLKHLTDTVDESSSVSMLDGTDIVYVARVPTRRLMTVAISVGTRFPAYATSMGRVLLAGLDRDERDRVLDAAELVALTPGTITSRARLDEVLDRVAAQGWALVDQELEVGLRSIAAPIHDAHGTVIAAANISMSATQGTVAEAQEHLLPPLLETASQIDRDLRVSAH